jgi:hypothetical protein
MYLCIKNHIKKGKWLMNKKYIFLLLLIPYYTRPVVIWNNVIDSGFASAFDQDVQINGDTWLPAEIITIQALNRDVKIYMVNGSHTVHGTRINADSTTIILEATFPWKIEIVVSEDLTFVGPEFTEELPFVIPIVIQERGIPIDDEYPIIQWTIAKDKKLRFGPSDDADFAGADLQIVSDLLFNMPRHIFKVNGSSDHPHIFFTRNSSLSIVQETFIGVVPFSQPILFDASNGQPRTNLVYFKDGSGLLLESVPLP